MYVDPKKNNEVRSLKLSIFEKIPPLSVHSKSGKRRFRGGSTENLREHVQNEIKSEDTECIRCDNSTVNNDNNNNNNNINKNSKGNDVDEGSGEKIQEESTVSNGSNTEKDQKDVADLKKISNVSDETKNTNGLIEADTRKVEGKQDSVKENLPSNAEGSDQSAANGEPPPNSNNTGTETEKKTGSSPGETTTNTEGNVTGSNTGSSTNTSAKSLVPASPVQATTSTTPTNATATKLITPTRNAAARRPLENFSEITTKLLILGKKTSGKYTLADFEVLRTIGTGSFGRVHLVKSNHNGRYYALKVLRKQLIVRLKQVEHANDERRMLSIISHPFITRMWGTFQDSQYVFMVMDFIEGGELFTLLRRSKRFPNPVAKFYAAEICLALEYLHKLNIIYRDLKPENILLDRSGHIKLTDFGFAKFVPDVTYTLCGTPDYIAPEVINTKPYNKSVDWWSFGILIYEMLSGHTPFYSSNTVQTYENILNAPLRFPTYFTEDARDILSRLINRDLTKRLGNLKNGTEDVKNHPWFREVVWDKLLGKYIETPYEPPLARGQGDTSQYEEYPEEKTDYGLEGDDPYHDLLKEF